MLAHKPGSFKGRSGRRDSGNLLREVQSWDEQHVADWLATTKCGAYGQLFIDNNIDGDVLLECDQDTLKELGIRKIGDRIRLHVAIKALRKRCLGIDQKPNLALSSIEVPHHGSIPPGPTTPASRVTHSTASSRNHSPANELYESSLRTVKIESPLPNGATVLQNCVKFIGEEGQTRIVNISDSKDAEAILGKALKKFSIRDYWDNWCVFVTEEIGPARCISSEELVSIAQDPNRPERERLILRKKNTAPSIAEFKRAQAIAQEQQAAIQNAAIAVNSASSMRKIEGFFGERPNQHARTGSTSTYNSPSHSPSHIVPPQYKDHEKTGSSIKRLKQFFGARPPSELISSNLAEYFPDHERTVLEETVRMSMRRSARMSQGGKRFSIATTANGFAMTPNLASSPVPSVGDAWLNAGASRPQGMPIRPLRPASIRRPISVISKADAIDHIRVPAIDEEISREDDDQHGLQNQENVETDELPEYLRNLSVQAEDDQTTTLKASVVVLTETEASEGESEDGWDQENNGPTKWIRGALIGQGSFGSVVLGMNAITGELMAVKQVDLPSQLQGESRKRTMIDALQREIALLRDLQHENIVQYLGSNSDASHLNIFLEYVPGGSVTALLNNYGAFEEPLIRNFVRQILQGLNYLHERNIIHRDIKGANVLVDNKGVIKISDFGISKKVASGLSLHANADHRPSLQGSVFWMAPEVVKQTSYTRKADIWSLGCLIVEMFTGQHPFPDYNQMQAIFKIGTDSPSPDVPDNASAEGKDFLTRTFNIDHVQRPTAEILLLHPFTSHTIS